MRNYWCQLNPVTLIVKGKSFEELGKILTFSSAERVCPCCQSAVKTLGLVTKSSYPSSVSGEKYFLPRVTLPLPPGHKKPHGCRFHTGLLYLKLKREATKRHQLGWNAAAHLVSGTGHCENITFVV